ncbi:MAG: ATP-binding protein [Acetobacteraceae bacterium]
MTEMIGDIVNRVRRLPKPTNAAEALQPLFEAVSNAMHATEDLFGKAESVKRGRITIDIKNLKTPTNVEIIITDNGIGLDDERFKAFCKTDTDFKASRGGKGVGRLLWLDAFERINVTSVYQDNGKRHKRSFRFQLTPREQITEEKISTVADDVPLGTIIKVVGLRGHAYATKFPSRPVNLIRHFGSHFIGEFIFGQSPQINMAIDDNSATFPADVGKLMVEDRGRAVIATDQFGELQLSSFICSRAASADFDGFHQLHFLADGRTVATRKIDGLLGIGRFGAGEYVYHGCVSGEFLNERVNQERTHFNFDESVSEEIAKACAQSVRENALQGEIEQFDGGRLEAIGEFLDEYPSFAFESPEDLLSRTPKNASRPEQFAQALIATRIRRDIERRKEVQKIVNTLSGEAEIPADFAEAVRHAAEGVKAEEQRQLTEYVLRRKMVLDVMDVLIRRVRAMASGKDDHHLESTLHQFICPMRIRGDDPKRVEQSDHDLWVIDERLAFAKYFASDVPFNQIIAESQSDERPDLVLFDRLHGLGLDDEEPLKRVMLVEFKKPGRKEYTERYSPMNQISRYLNELVSGKIEKFNRDRIRIADDCIFYCYVVADIVGNLDIDTSSWRTTANGRGRWMELSGKYRGTIEVIEWKDIIGDARSRNRAFINAAGFKA